MFSLCPFEVAIIVLALTPEIDLRYERLYAYLQDDVTRKRPTEDLILNLLCSSPEEKIRRRRHFAADAALRRQRLLRVFADCNALDPSSLSHCVKVDEQIVRFLLGQDSVDERLAGICSLTPGCELLDVLPLQKEVKHALPNVLQAATEAEGQLILHLRGSSKLLMRRTAEASCASALKRQVLVADLSRHAESGLSTEELLFLILRDAKLHGAIPYLERADQWDKEVLSRGLGEATGIVLLGTGPELLLSADKHRVITVDLPALNLEQQRECWEQALSKRDVEVDSATLDSLVSRMRLSPEQISEAAALSCSQARWRTAQAAPLLEKHRQPPVTGEELYAAARAQAGSELGSVALKLQPNYRWDDLVLPEATVTQLHEVCERIAHREQVLQHWGFDRKLSFGKGTTALFAGPSGTGKTMAAEVIANEVRLDLYKIDLAGVVSKYIGETEKNLDRIFAAAQGTNTILLFDEADALFGKRSEVRDSHDRYANLEISYLLQKMDAYEGTAILSSNLRHHMDESFIRRLAFTVLFPFPEETDRRQIWSRIWPEATPLAGDINLDYLARRFKLSGGNIKNVALAAAFLAAGDGGRVKMGHLLRAVQREYQKMGREIHSEELTPEAEQAVSA
jgi:SpoVK/Ycf46/Vps4 family AAA+-type ATPase